MAKLTLPFPYMGMSAASILNRLLRDKNPKPKAPRATTKALTTTIRSHLKAGRLRKAVSILFASPSPVPYSLYARLFQLCSSNSAIVEARKVESHLVTFYPTPPVFLLNRAIETYGECGCLADARELFDEMPQRDGGSWNSIIKAYVRGGYAEKALSVFCRMNKEGIFPNEITLASVLGSCAAVLELALSRQVHGLVLKYGFSGNVILESSLVDVYGKCWVMTDARKMFDEIENPNNVSWNVIVRRYLEVGGRKEAVVMFFKMLREDVTPLNFTFSNALSACSRMLALKEGLQIHGVAVKINFEEDEVVLSSLIDMYVKCGKLENAHKVFDQPNSKNLISWTSIVSGYAMSGRTGEARQLFNEMPERNVISWNAMLAGYINFSQWEEALDFVFLMRKTTEDIDHVTVGLILNVCAGFSDVEMGKQVHAYIYRHNLYSIVFVGNSLLDMYGKCGNLKGAELWFYQMSQLRDSVSWTSLLTSYARHRMSEQAMTIFGEMQWETRPSKFTLGTLLAACANIFALEQGKQVHGFMIRNAYDIDIVILGAMVDMYSKCRRIDYALMVFKAATSRDVVLWNSIILGCYHNGRSTDALELFGLMRAEGAKPDNITFHGVLLACINEGLVELGSCYFNSMSTEHSVIPRLEHYECMIELFSQHGCMELLENFIQRMPFDPTVPMLTRVFDACREHGYWRLGDWTAKRLNELNDSTPI